MELTLTNFDILLDIWGTTDGLKMSFAGNQWFVIPELLSYIYKAKEYQHILKLYPPDLLERELKEKN